MSVVTYKQVKGALRAPDRTRSGAGLGDDERTGTNPTQHPRLRLLRGFRALCPRARRCRSTRVNSTGLTTGLQPNWGPPSPGDTPAFLSHWYQASSAEPGR